MNADQLRKVSIYLANAWFELDEALKIIPPDDVEGLEGLHLGVNLLADGIHGLWKRIQDLKRS